MSPKLQPVFRVQRQNPEVCIHHYLVSSSVMRCWKCSHLRKRCCCNWQNDITLDTHCNVS